MANTLLEQLRVERRNHYRLPAPQAPSRAAHHGGGGSHHGAGAPSASADGPGPTATAVAPRRAAPIHSLGAKVPDTQRNAHELGVQNTGSGRTTLALDPDDIDYFQHKDVLGFQDSLGTKKEQHILATQYRWFAKTS